MMLNSPSLNNLDPPQNRPNRPSLSPTLPSNCHPLFLFLFLLLSHLHTIPVRRPHKIAAARIRRLNTVVEIAVIAAAGYTSHVNIFSKVHKIPIGVGSRTRAGKLNTTYLVAGAILLFVSYSVTEKKRIWNTLKLLH
jgi:uncharacterized membrane protein YadS